MNIENIYFGEKRIVTEKEYITGPGQTLYEVYLNSGTEYTAEPIEYLILQKIGKNKYRDVFSRKTNTTNFNQIGDIFIDDRENHLIPYISITNPEKQKINRKIIKQDLEKLKEFLLSFDIFKGTLTELEIDEFTKKETYKLIEVKWFSKENEHSYVDIETRQTYQDYAISPGEIFVTDLVPLPKDNDILTNNNIIKAIIKTKQQIKKEKIS